MAKEDKIKASRDRFTQADDYANHGNLIAIFWSHYEPGKSEESCDNQEY